MGVFKLGKMTLGSLFKEPETIQYPLVEKVKPKGLKGRVVIDAEKCILCSLCARSCSTDCITVSKPDAYWEINRYQCVQCGYCITVCPKKCLSMSRQSAPATTEITPDRFLVIPKDKEPVTPAPEIITIKEDEDSAPATEPVTETATDLPSDAQVEQLLALMDAERAEKVKAALR